MPKCPRPYDTSSQGYTDWAFMSTHFWDEDPQGTWTLVLENKGDAYNTGERHQAGAGTKPWLQVGDDKPAKATWPNELGSRDALGS